MIERWYNKDKKSKKEISELLGKSERTIRREINRGKTITKDYLWRDVEEYSAEKAHQKYEYNKTGKGPEMKLDKNKKLVEHIEKEIKENKKSPEVIVEELEGKGFKRELCGRTIRNAIKQGIIFDIEKKDMIYNKKKKKKNADKRVSSKVPSEKSIDCRPKEANDRSEYGHWEGDLVIGKRKKRSSIIDINRKKNKRRNNSKTKK